MTSFRRSRGSPPLCASQDVLLGARRTSVAAALTLVACGSDAPATSATSSSASSSSTARAQPPPVLEPDLAAIRELVHAGRLRAEKELTELLAPPTGSRPAGPGRLAAVGPCVTPSAEELEKLDERVREWALAQKNPWIPTTAKGAKLEPLEWGCMEKAGIVVRIAVEYQPRCENHHAVLRVGETIDVLSESWTPGLGCDHVFYDATTVAGLVDVDGDGTREPLTVHDHHGQIWSEQWIFVPGKTPDPRLEIDGDYGATDVPARIVKSDAGLVAYWPPPSHADQPGLHGFFVEIRKDGVVTARSPLAESFAKRLGAIHTAIGAEKRLKELGEETTPPARARLRNVMREAGVAEPDVMRLLGGETRDETLARVSEAAAPLAKTASQILSGEAREGVGPCAAPVAAYASPFQIPTWGACTVPGAEARARVEPAIREWLEKESGALLAKAHPKTKDRTKVVPRGEVVARYGCDEAGAFFVALDGGRPERVSVLFRWDGKALVPLTAASGSRCVRACIEGEERRLDIALTDLDADGDVEAIVGLRQGCGASPILQNLDDRCTKTEVFWTGPAPQTKPGGGLVREDPKGSFVCRVGDAVHVLEDGRDPVTPIKPVVAMIGRAGFEPPGDETPYAHRIAQLKAQVDAARLLNRPEDASSERLRAAMKLFDVAEPDVAVIAPP